jgi:hypothetical protein
MSYGIGSVLPGLISIQNLRMVMPIRIQILQFQSFLLRLMFFWELGVSITEKIGMQIFIFRF